MLGDVVPMLRAPQRRQGRYNYPGNDGIDRVVVDTNGSQFNYFSPVGHISIFRTAEALTIENP
jgi:hypothetical protein